MTDAQAPNGDTRVPGPEESQVNELATEPGDLMRVDRRFGNVVREGPWVVPSRIEVSLAAANLRLDFTEAVITVGVVQLAVDLGLGSELTLVVQPGVHVVAENLDARWGDFKNQAPYDGNVPVFLRVEVTGRLTGGGDLVVKRPKRNFDQRTRPGRAT
jgi:hypothetical protein